MGRYIVKRLLTMIPVLFVSSVVIFAGIRFIPGDVCALVLQTSEYLPEQCTAIEQRLGLDQPFAVQYFDWITGALRGDLGLSMISEKPVMSQIQQRMYLTIEMTLLAATFAMVAGVPMGIYSAVKQNGLADLFIRLTTIGWLSMPGFWIATLLITFAAKWFGYSPPVGYVNFWVDPWKNLQQLYMPAISIGLALSASMSRFTRSSMLEVLRQDYIRTAQAKGLGQVNILSRHALKNALLPVVTLFGLQLGNLLGGTVILESIYSLPGLGTLLLGSVNQKDYTQVQAIVLFYAVVISVITLLVDLSYAWIDPRTKYE